MSDVQIRPQAATAALMKSKEVWEFLGISESTFRRRLKDGTIPEPIRAFGPPRFRRAEIEALIASPTN